MKRLLMVLLIVLVMGVASDSHSIIGGAMGGFGATGGGTVYTDCSQRGTAAFYWNGDYTGNSQTGCISGGTKALVPGGWEAPQASIVASGTDPGVASPESGANCLKVLALTYGEVAISSGDIFDSSVGTITMSVYMTGQTGWNDVAVAYDSSSNNLYMSITNAGELRIGHVGNGTENYLTSSATISTSTWTTIKAKWRTTSGQIAVKIGDNAWQTSDVTLGTFSAQPIRILFGEQKYGVANTLYIDNIRVYKSYEN